MTDCNTGEHIREYQATWKVQLTREWIREIRPGSKQSSITLYTATRSIGTRPRMARLRSNQRQGKEGN